MHKVQGLGFRVHGLSLGVTCNADVVVIVVVVGVVGVGVGVGVGVDAVVVGLRRVVSLKDKQASGLVE